MGPKGRVFGRKNLENGNGNGIAVGFLFVKGLVCASGLVTTDTAGLGDDALHVLDLGLTAAESTELERVVLVVGCRVDMRAR